MSLSLRSSKKGSSLPPLPTALDQALVVENRRPQVTGDHTTIAARYEAPSGRGGEFFHDRFSIFLDGKANGYLTVRGSVPAAIAGGPRTTSDRIDFTVPIDVLLPLLIGIERAAELLVAHEKVAERALANRGQLSELLSNGWNWF